jgi:glycosyltransferase involved in cell wall biosynthesis
MPVILHVVNSYFAVPYFIGGQFRYFKDKGHQIHLICPESKYLDDYSKEMGFVYKNIEIARTYSILKDLKAFISIRKYIKCNNFDIIVGHTPKAALLTMVAGWFLKTPKRIYFRHGLVYETATGFGRKVLIIMEKVTAFCSTQIICVSSSVYEVSLKDNLNKREKQTVLGKGTCSGIDTIYKFNPELVSSEELQALRRNYNIYEGDIILGFCGRLVRDKGIIELVEAFELLRKEIKWKRLVLLLVGILEVRDNLPVELITRIRTDKDIIFTGFINSNIQNYYAMMSVYILPSYREGFPTGVLEASAMQIPVLTTRSTGCIDSIIENVTGKFVEISPDSIAEGVKFFLDNPQQAKNYGNQGREFVRLNFDNHIIWKELEMFYF